MKIKTISLLLVLILSLSMTAFASDRQLPLLVDDADILSASEEDSLLTILENISQSQQCEVAIVTTDSLDGRTATEYADDFYDYNGYGYGPDDDGILFLLDMGERNWAISTYGKGIYAFTNAGQAYIVDQILYDLGEGYYYTALSSFAYLCEDFLIQANQGQPYDSDNLPKSPLPIMLIPISILIGFVIAFITVKVMASGLKSVRRQAAASSYVREGSFNLTDSHDTYLYSTVSKTKRSTESSGSSTHSSSSGRSHGGSSGKF